VNESLRIKEVGYIILGKRAVTLVNDVFYSCKSLWTLIGIVDHLGKSILYLGLNLAESFGTSREKCHSVLVFFDKVSLRGLRLIR
jgi:hypothetical protein